LAQPVFSEAFLQYFITKIEQQKQAKETGNSEISSGVA